jgi:Ca2+-binding RTX toxin-like protein
MTRLLTTTLAAALATVVALGLIGPASGRAAAATEPTLTLTRNCEVFRDDGADTIDIRLTGFPPSTPFEVTVAVSDGHGIGPWEGTTDASGNAEPGTDGIHTHQIWRVTVVWAGGTLIQSLYVDCTSPDGAVTVIPSDQSIPGCGLPPSFPKKALQGHEGDDTIDGNAYSDLLAGGGGDDSLSGGYGFDCLAGQRGADELSGEHGDDDLFGQQGADLLKGERGEDAIRGGDGRDTISGGKAHDHVFDTDGRNLISCGKGIDKVLTNQRSEVAPNCEQVTRR